MTHENTNPTNLGGGPYVVAKNAQIDTRKAERARAERPAGPFNGVSTDRSRDVLRAGDPISAEDLEGGSEQLAMLVKLGHVVSTEVRRLPSVAPKTGLVVAPGMTLNSRRGVHMSGDAVYAHDFTTTDLENLIRSGTIVRATGAPSPSNPPEAA